MIKELASWTFTSSVKQFDGLRIVLEAADVGIELLEVERSLPNGATVRWLMCTPNYVSRLDNADLEAKFPRDRHLRGEGWVPCIPPTLDDYILTTDEHPGYTSSSESPYSYKFPGAHATAIEIHDELVYREQMCQRTHVRGYA